MPEPGAPIRLAARRGGAADVLEGELAPVDEAWRLDGEAVSLAFEAATPPSPGGTSGELEASGQVCRVTGRLTVGGQPVEIECLGWHASVQGIGDLSHVASFRWLAAWLGPRDGFSLIAARPRKSRGHGADLIAASLIEEPPFPRIDDPRLSTTYSDAGLPIRAGLELWPEVHVEEDPEPDRTPHYPRRATGELAGDRLAWEAGGFLLDSSPLQWRSRGREGPGVYLLGQRT